MHARPIRSSLGPDPNGSALVCTGPKSLLYILPSKKEVTETTGCALFLVSTITMMYLKIFQICKAMNEADNQTKLITKRNPIRS